ncbi:MAG: hypothetical protein NWF04_07825 [Candidatus Bathyarchaeota archaeon]|nr:hypothetical protein [Candidatus Bathyarchaeota archaeon]
MIAAVIFDLDGTLVDIPIDYPSMYAEFRQILGTADVCPLTQKIPQLPPELKAKVFAAWDKAEDAAKNAITPKPQGMTLYQKHVNKPKALVTLQGKALAAPLIQELNLPFDVVLTREDSLNRQEQLQTAAKQLNHPLKNILFIGNSDSDQKAAQTLNCQFIRIT